jgi:YD repeat-containing protein
LNAYANDPSPDNTEALENFLDANPNNPWTLSVQTNLGLLYAKGCYWTKALNMLDRVWNRGKKQAAYKNSVDMALSKLAFIAARLGRVQYMQQLETSVGGRILTPNAQDTYLRAKQSLDREVNHPEQGFLCGAQAVQAILTANNPGEVFTPAVGQVQSTQQGVSLTTVANLANAVGLQMTPVEWTSHTVQIPTPAVIHWNSGHYAALVGRTADGGYHLVDHTMELDTTVSPSAIQQEGSGYFLIPTGSVTSDFTPLTQVQTDNIWGKGGAPASTPLPPADVAPTADSSSSNGLSCKNNNSSTGPDSGSNSYAGLVGMPAWAVDKLRIALILKDTPIAYHPPLGPTIAFNLEYNHKNTSPSSTAFATYLGLKWTLNYSSYLVPSGSSVTQYGPGGGTLTYSNLNAQTGQYAPQYYTQNLLTKTGPYSYVLTFKNGGSYTFASPFTQGSSQYVFLTAMTDPQGNSITFTYDPYHRLLAVTDAAGGTSKLSYQQNDPTVPATYYLVQSITSPYGGTASFAYDSSYQLTSITDPVGITSEFTYVTSPGTNGDYIGTLTTPYGNTNFLLKQIGDDYSDFALIVTDPLGATREIEFTDDLALQEPQPFPQTPLGYSGTYAGATYEWDTQNYSATTTNYAKATKTQWLIQWNGSGSDQVPYYVGPVLENPIVYSYAGQNNAAVEGTSSLPSNVQTVLPDGSTQTYSYTYNAFGETTSATDPLGRTTTYNYATNGIDLLSVSQGGNRLFSANYNGIHSPI